MFTTLSLYYQIEDSVQCDVSAENNFGPFTIGGNILDNCDAV